MSTPRERPYWPRESEVVRRIMPVFLVRHTVVSIATLVVVLAVGQQNNAAAQSPNPSTPQRTIDVARNSTANQLSGSTQSTTTPETQSTPAEPAKTDDMPATDTATTNATSPSDDRHAEAKSRAAAALADESRQLALEEAPAPTTDIAAMALDADQQDQKKSTPEKLAKSDKSVCVAGCN
jgi:hypothetical protein